MQFTVPPTLPEGCIANILSFTSPLDACRSALVSPTFRSAASSDAVWERFLPADYQDIISKSSLKLSSLDSLSKKDLFFHLCHHPVILNNGSLDDRMMTKMENEILLGQRIQGRQLQRRLGNDVLIIRRQKPLPDSVRGSS
ncbi:F-box domain - like 10 [Theobroma cacao]|nr:F-box domain - like 10 [Theobroma cacao]